MEAQFSLADYEVNLELADASKWPTYTVYVIEQHSLEVPIIEG